MIVRSCPNEPLSHANLPAPSVHRQLIPKFSVQQIRQIQRQIQRRQQARHHKKGGSVGGVRRASWHPKGCRASLRPVPPSYEPASFRVQLSITKPPLLDGSRAGHPIPRKPGAPRPV